MMGERHTKQYVLWRKRHRHLASISVRAGVGHAELAGLGMAELEVLIRKLVSVDGFTASSIALGEISTLA